MNDPASRPPLVLRTIALIEGIKGVLALGAAGGLLSLRHTDLHAAADTFLLHHGINPERHYTRFFIEGIAKATNHHVIEISAICLVYGLVRLGEAYGLWQAKHWAEWLAVISAGVYLPLELYHFAHRSSLFTAGVILFNVVIVLYLARLLQLQRAQRHAH